jgi:integrase
MQRGHVFKYRRAWYVKYYDVQLVNGVRVTKRVCKKLAPVNEVCRIKSEAQTLADKILNPINTGAVAPESSMLVVDFIETVFLPYVQREMRPSTYKNYRKDLFEKHIKSRLGDIRLRDFRTVHGQRLLRAIPAGRTTMLRAKAMLSSAFKHARREGILDSENPMRDTSVMGRPSKSKGPVYSLNEIEGLLIAPYNDDGTARVVVATAALTGLRMSELRALRWTDFDGESIRVARSVWRTHIGPPKTEDSEATVPVLPLLQRVLEKYRKDAPAGAYIFAGQDTRRKREGTPQRGFALNLANLAARVIKPAIQTCAKCQKARSEHKEESHAFEWDKVQRWKGWHAFRRGLASNLYSLGVQPKVIQAILRHSDIGTTLSYYVQTPDEESRDALQQIESAFPFGL